MSETFFLLNWLLATVLAPYVACVYGEAMLRLKSLINMKTYTSFIELT